MHSFFESLIRGFGRLHSPSGKSQTRGHSAPSRITVLSLSCPIVAKTIDCRPARMLKKVLWLSAPTIRSSAQQCFSSTCHWPQTSDTSGLPSVTTLVETWKATFVPRPEPAQLCRSVWLQGTCENLRLESKCQDLSSKFHQLQRPHFDVA